MKVGSSGLELVQGQIKYYKAPLAWHEQVESSLPRFSLCEGSYVHTTFSSAERLSLPLLHYVTSQ